jgi:anti-anti-sigma regulatory factor
MIRPSRVLICTAQDDQGQARITVTAEIDRELVEKLRQHVQAVVRAGARFVVLDVSEVRRCDPIILNLMSWAQHRLTARQGMISAVGLHPCKLAERAPYSADPGTAATVTLLR